jgi:hypothetical protein
MRWWGEGGLERSIWRLLLITWVLALAGLFAPTACNRTPQQTSFNPTRQVRTVRAAAHDSQDLRLFVDPGTAVEAADYARHVESVLGFPAAGTLDELLAYCGVAGVTARELETLRPDELQARLAGRVLATRFFAPKIIDVSSVGGPAATKDLGWRKLVRLAVDPASPAGARNLDAL